MEEDLDEPHEHPISWELDLHTFRPNEVGDLIPEYIRECRLRGILHVRIIHGKGTGTLREGVHRLLEKLPEVISFKLGDQTTGGWGATLAWLKPVAEGENLD